MFQWLRNLLRPRDRRLVFHYWDGTRKRSADPVEIERALVAVLGRDWLGGLAALTKPVPRGLVGIELDEARTNHEQHRSKVLYAIDTAFDVRPFKDGVGLTEIERLALVTGFNRFCVDLIVLARPFAKQQSRASPPSATPPTASGAGSTSVGT